MGIDMVMIAQAMVDACAVVDEAFMERNGLEPGGAKVVVPEEARKLEAESGGVSYVSGGSAANTAATLGRLGKNVAFFGPTGNDAAGIAFHRGMADAGVFCFHNTVPGGDTGKCLVFVPPCGDRSMVASPGISGDISETVIPAGLCEQARLCFCEGFLFSFPKAIAVMQKAAAATRRGDGKVVLSVGAAWCAAANQKEMMDFVENHADIVLANEAEVMALLDVPDFGSALAIWQQMGKTVVITQGSKGAVVVSGGSIYTIPSQASQVVDTTGAGDSFAAGFLNGLLDGMDVLQAGAWGAALAAEVVGHVGARPKRHPKQVLGIQPGI